MREPVVCYPGLGKKKGLAICEAFAAGCGGRVQTPGTARSLAPGAAFFYGVTDDNSHLFEQARGEGRDWYYSDNAYAFGRGQYFRVTRGALQHTGEGVADPARWRAFGVEIKPWRPHLKAAPVIVASQSDLWHLRHHGLSAREWAHDVKRELITFTERPINVALKPAASQMRREQAHVPDLAERLRGAWAFVTYTSSAAVAALIEGVPVFTTGRCCASDMGRMDLSRIETPAFPDDRERWLAVLAANQWTLDELRNGTAWRALRGTEAVAA